jgi:hypothetical protein
MLDSRGLKDLKIGLQKGNRESCPTRPSVSLLKLLEHVWICSAEVKPVTCGGYSVTFCT